MKIKNKTYFSFGVKRFRQNISDDLCGIKALESIYDFFGVPQDDGYFIRELALADEYAFLPQLMKLAARDGLNVHINISNPYVFDLTWTNISQKELIGKLHDTILNLETRWKRAAEEYLLYVSEGNTISQKVICEKLIADYLQQGKLVIAFVDNVIFQQRGRRYWDEVNKTYEPDDVKGASDGHVVVIDGWSETKGFHIVDSSSVQTYSPNGRYWIDPTVLIAGIYTFSGEIGVIWK